MYYPLPDNPTKEDYSNLLLETISYVNALKNSEIDDYLYTLIIEQLIDIKEMIVDKRELIDEDEINERYSLGGIATRNFEEGNEMRERLCAIFSGAMDFAFLPEKE